MAVGYWACAHAGAAVARMLLLLPNIGQGETDLMLWYIPSEGESSDKNTDLYIIVRSGLHTILKYTQKRWQDVGIGLLIEAKSGANE